METSQRLYLVYDTDKVFYFENWKNDWPHERREQFRKIKWDDRDTMSMIDLWGKPWSACKWVGKYFRVYRSTKDKTFQNLM